MRDSDAVQVTIDAADEGILSTEQVRLLLEALDSNYPEVFETYLDAVVDSMAKDDDNNDSEPEQDLGTDSKPGGLQS